MAGVVKVKYTVGVGNNIFQYMYARLLAEAHGLNLSTPALECLEVEKTEFDFDPSLPCINIGKSESNFHQYMDKNRPPSNYYVFAYPEDYTLYTPHIDTIRGWVDDIPMVHQNDLVLHLRLGDRLLRKSDYDPSMHTTVDEYIESIEKFNYNQLYIVTDMKKWEYITPQDVCEMKFHTNVSIPDRIAPSESTRYFNSLVKGLSDFNPIVRTNNLVHDDFNFMRSFGQILFKHGTLAWWAAALSHAYKVGVYGPWRPIKGERNKNLGETDFNEWFQWGFSNG